MSKSTTKLAIAFAFKELLLEKPLNKITINDIEKNTIIDERFEKLQEELINGD